jgi:hypothetical protein
MSLLELAYFLALLTVVAAHFDRVPEISHMSIFDVPWFFGARPSPSSPKAMTRPPPPEAYASPLPRAHTHMPRVPFDGTQRYTGSDVFAAIYTPQSTALALEDFVDIEKQDRTGAPILFHRSSTSEHAARPVWAQDAPRTRRGVDPPFGGLGNGAPRAPPAMRMPCVVHAPAVHSRFSFETRSDEASVGIVLPSRQGSPSVSIQSDDAVVRGRPANPMEEVMLSSASLPIPRPPHSRQPSEQRHISEFPENVLDEDKPIPTDGTVNGWVGAVGGSIGTGVVYMNSTSPRPQLSGSSIVPSPVQAGTLAEWKEVQAKRGWTVHSSASVRSSHSSVLDHI